MAEAIVIGNTLADLNFELPAEYLHRFGQEQGITFPFGTKLEAESYTLNPGGSGANVAVGLQLAGIETTFVTGIGADSLGIFLKERLEQSKIKLVLDEHDQPSNISVVLRAKAERTIISAHTNQYSYLTHILPQTGLIHIGPLPASEDRFFEHLLQHQAKTSQPVSCNPSLELLSERTRHFMIALKSMELLFVNQEEAAILARLPRRTSGAELSRALQRFGPKMVVVTCGEKGAYLATQDSCYFVGVMSDRAARVDATGTGDAFTSGFLAGYLDDSVENEYQLITQAMAFAALNSGSVVTRVGGQNGLLNRDELEHQAPTVTLKKVEE